MTTERKKRAREAALACANEACRNMDGELDLQAMAQHFLAFAAEKDWQPITNAEKDGRRIHVINDRGQFMVEWDTDWSPDGWWLCVDGKHDDRPLRGSEPTYFRPLPTPPATPTAKEDRHGRG